MRNPFSAKEMPSLGPERFSLNSTGLLDQALATLLFLPQSYLQATTSPFTRHQHINGQPQEKGTSTSLLCLLLELIAAFVCPHPCACVVY